MNKEAILEKVERKLASVYEEYGDEKWSRHEFYAILKEDFDQLWSDIRFYDSQYAIENDVKDIIAICFRYLLVGNRKYPNNQIDIINNM